MHQFNWTPGIGDPTIEGWVTVTLYAAATVSCWVTARKCVAKERRIWANVSFLFLALGINKQLDLQSALTELGRVLAYQEGWYDKRQWVQISFIFSTAFICVGTLVVLSTWAYRAPLPTWIAFFGTTLVFCFVLIRAASFHHIDRFIGSTLLGFRWNWMLEIGGISAVLLASLWRQRSLTAT